MSRQNFYKGRKVREKKKIEGEKVIELVKGERKRHPRMGGRKILVNIRNELIKSRISIGRDKFFDILRSSELLIKRRKRRVPKTTDSNHAFKKYPNLIKGLEITRANQVWQSDITYLDTLEGNLYLSLITDSFSRKIVGENIGDTLETQGCLKALKKALRTLKRKKGTIHHSDRGCQYSSREYVALLNRHGFQVSMTEENHCYENAKAERVNGILKEEYGLCRVFKNKAEAKAAVKDAIMLYNNFRPHVSLKYEIPSMVHAKYAA